MVSRFVDWRNTILNLRELRMGSTKITATPDEINQVCDGAGASATAVNLTALTDEKVAILAAAGGGGSGPVRILDAATDGVLVGDVMAGASEWTANLTTGSAATRNHATALVSLPDMSAALGMDTSYWLSVESTLLPGVGDGVNNASSVNVFRVEVDRYRDTDYALWGDGVDESGTRSPGGAVFTDGPLTTLTIKAIGIPSGLPLVPPAGGHVEVWVQ